jgi:hypothetical protein
MKMKNLSFYALLGAAMFLTASCDKDVESTSLKVDLATTITVKGYVYAQLDKTSAGLEFAPAGTDLILSVAYADLDGNAATSAGKWKDTVKVGNSGDFTATIPVDDNGVTLTIDAQPFEYEQVSSYGSNVAKEKRIYQAPTKLVGVSTSSNSIIEITYNDNALASTVTKIKVNLTFTAELDASLTGEEAVVGQTVELFNSGWAQQYTTNSDGKITAEVPSGENVYYTINFNYNKKVVSGAGFALKQYNYSREYIFLGSYTLPTTTTISLGNGTAL